MAELRRLGVTGGRDYDNWHIVVHALRQMPETAVLVHGAATGADALCAEWWDMQEREAEAHPADWKRHGKAAGFIRNQEMVDSGLDLLLVFPGGRGTGDMRTRALEAGVPVLDVMRGQVTAVGSSDCEDRRTEMSDAHKILDYSRRLDAEIRAQQKRDDRRRAEEPTPRPYRMLTGSRLAYVGGYPAESLSDHLRRTADEIERIEAQECPASEGVSHLIVEWCEHTDWTTVLVIE